MKVRTLTAIIALIVFLPILLKGGLVLMIFANILALIALKELLNMNMIKFVSVPGLISWSYHHYVATTCRAMGTSNSIKSLK